MLHLERGTCITIDLDEVPSLEFICSALIPLISKNSYDGLEIVDLRDPENPFRNTLCVGKLSIPGAGSFHVKVVQPPDTDSEYLPSVLSKFPELEEDPYVLVPAIIPVVSFGEPDPMFYVHLTKWVDSQETLAQFIVSKWFHGSHAAVKTCLFQFGKFLRGFHSKYPGLQHTDMNPSNVLMVAATCGVSIFILADCSGLDDQVGSDFQTFIESLKVLAEGGFGDEFLTLATSAFTEGYETP